MKYPILRTLVDTTSYVTAAQQILEWASAGESRYVCAANVHMVMEAYDHPDFCALVNAADLVTPDGMPLVWMMRLMGVKEQERVYGPDLTLRVAKSASEYGLAVGVYGGTPQANEHFALNLQKRFPGLKILYRYSPPFRPLSPEEDLMVIDSINSSGVRILFVGLGCPNQERWMAEHKGRIAAVMLGVGAAFDFLAGLKPQAPAWMQRAGLEWLFRLMSEPKRLWRRYLVNNPRFIWLALAQMLGWWRPPDGE